MAGALWALLAALIGYGLNDVIKELVREPRPCRRFPAAPTLAPCDLATDYAFPSNHATVMAAAAIALLAVGTLPAVLAFALTLLAGVSRVALGMHYPHDVLAGLLLGAAVGCVGLLARRPLTTWVERRRAGGWRLLATSAGRSTRNKY
jgi:undecaprenyl-diphosphatase